MCTKETYQILIVFKDTLLKKININLAKLMITNINNKEQISQKVYGQKLMRLLP